MTAEVTEVTTPYLIDQIDLLQFDLMVDHHYQHHQYELEEQVLIHNLFRLT
jgi:hypothetical protein